MIISSNVLANICIAAATIHSTELCCNSFTVFLPIPDWLELRRVEFHHALPMALNINLASQEKNTEATIEQSVQRTEHILRGRRLPIPETTADVNLHYCALAAQFLCSAFLSYIQAHFEVIRERQAREHERLHRYLP